MPSTDRQTVSSLHWTRWCDSVVGYTAVFRLHQPWRNPSLVTFRQVQRRRQKRLSVEKKKKKTSDN